VRQVRSDARLVANHLLARIPDLADRCFFVDPFGGPEGAARSRAGLRAAHLWLKDGGALIIFPAGMVAPGIDSDGRCVDGPWHSTVGRLALATGATVVPAFIDGRNSRAFYRAGRLHPVLRTLMLGRELLAQRKTTVRVFFGEALRPRVAEPDAEPSATTMKIRKAVERLSEPATGGGERVIDPVDPRLLEQDLCGREPLVTVGGLDVFCATSGELPNVLREIGRLRELTFREVGEGTGRSLDLDRFDGDYLHLFAWNPRSREVVGAYRIGQTDRILASRGIGGLYTSTLFQFDARLMQKLSPALELGRSFVRREYQRNPAALMVLWKGIAQFIVRNPHYRTLFGPVSISSRYRETSQHMLLEFLQQNHRDEELAELVRALNPPSLPPLPGRATGRIGDLDALIAAAEPDGKGVPVLLRQYLRLNARVIGFNVDPAFGDALDALVTVDLLSTDPAILARYMGKQGMVSFVQHHRQLAA
jgi:putative hemolysin